MIYWTLLKDLQAAVLDNRRANLELAINYAKHQHVGTAGTIPAVAYPTPNAIEIAPTIASQAGKVSQDILGATNVAGLRENYLNSNFRNI